MLDMRDMKRFIQYRTQDEAEVLASKLITIVANSKYSNLRNYGNDDEIISAVLDFLRAVAIEKDEYMADYEAEQQEVE